MTFRESALAGSSALSWGPNGIVRDDQSTGIDRRTIAREVWAHGQANIMIAEVYSRGTAAGRSDLQAVIA